MNPNVFPPFLVHEADFALYLSDEAGNYDMDAVFLGGRLEDLSPELSFTKQRLDRHGDPFGSYFHTDEEHRFTVRNLWTIERGTNLLPEIGRNQPYIMVVRWVDPELRTWAKRTYYGVKADSQTLALEDQVYHENIAFTARYADPDRAGYLNPPDLLPAWTGSLRYVTPIGGRDIYRFDFETGDFVVLDPALLATRARIVSAPDSWELQFGSTPALRITADGVEVNVLSVVGGTFPLANPKTPRVEFVSGRTRLAAVTAAGELAVPDLTEVDVEPVAAARDWRVAVGADWGFTLSKGKAYALDFSETLT